MALLGGVVWRRALYTMECVDVERRVKEWKGGMWKAVSSIAAAAVAAMGWEEAGECDVENEVVGMPPAATLQNERSCEGVLSSPLLCRASGRETLEDGERRLRIQSDRYSGE